MAIDKINATSLLDGGVSTADIADGNITSDKMDAQIQIDERLTVGGTNTGSVLVVDGAGVSSGELLKVQNTTGAATVRIVSSDSGSNYINFQDTTGTGGSISYSHGSDIMVVRSGGSNAEVFRINGTGISFNGGASYLDDYEEGSFTPTWSNLTVGNAPSNTGHYVKVGKLVNVYFAIVLGSTSSVTGGAIVTNLPFTVSRRHYGGGHCENTAVDTWQARGRATEGTTNCNVQLAQSSSTYSLIRGISATAPFTWGNGDTIVINVVYETT